MSAIAATPAWLQPRRRLGILGATLGFEAVLVGILGYADVAGLGSDWLWAVGWVVVAGVGAALAASRPGNPIGWILYGGGAGTLLAMVLGGLAALAGNAWLQVISLLLFGTAWLATTSLALVHFPDGRVHGRVMRALRVAVWVLVGVTAVAIIVNPAGVGVDFPLASPLGIPALGAWPMVVADVAQAAGAIVTVFATVLLLVRWYRADGAKRRRLGWIALAAFIAATLAVASVAVLASGIAVPDWLGGAIELVQVTLPALIAAGVIDPRAFDIEAVLGVSLVAVSLTGAVVAVFALVLWAANQAFGSQASPIAALIASGLVAVGLAPAKAWLETMVRRRLFGVRHEPAGALAGTASAIASAASADDSIIAAAALVGTSLRLGGLDLHVAGGETVSWCARPDGLAGHAPVVERRLIALGEDQGTVVAHGRSQGDDRASLVSGIDALAPLLALVVSGVRTADSLRMARERAAEAREHERSRLQRELHDGVGPVLVGVSMQLDAWRDVAGPEHAESVARAGAQLRDAITGLRRAIVGLRPPELDQLGLRGALAERAFSLESGGLDARLVCPEAAVLADLPPAVEVAAYLIASEAAANVVRHAGATSCVIRVARRDDALIVRVEDDGRAPAIADQSGVGIPSMRARAEELGGRVVIGPGVGGGWVVEAVLPVGGPA